MEAVRCLKRCISREVYTLLRNQNRLINSPPLTAWLGQSLYKQAVPAVTVAVPWQTEYESTWKLLEYSVYYTPEYRIGLTRAGIG